MISIFHLEGRIYSAVSSSRVPLLQLRACVIFTAQVIAIQLRGRPAGRASERPDGQQSVYPSPTRSAAGLPSIIEHPPPGARRDGKRHKASISVQQWSISGQTPR